MQHKARKRFGQHFLVDENVLQHIVNSIGLYETDTVVEIGPGKGALTQYLIHRCRSFIAIELDRDLAGMLPIRFPTADMQVIQADALTVALDQLSEAPFRLIGNLPYNISTPLLFHFLDHIGAWQDAHIMVQKEVADRLIATPSDSNYGRLSVMLQVQCHAEKLFDIGPEAFSPPPKVQSSILRLKPLKEPPLTSEDMNSFSRLVKTGFGQRRKTLSNNFKGLLSAGEIEALGISHKARPQTLGITDWVTLYSVWRQLESRV